MEHTTRDHLKMRSEWVKERARRLEDNGSHLKGMEKHPFPCCTAAGFSPANIKEEGKSVGFG